MSIQCDYHHNPGSQSYNKGYVSIQTKYEAARQHHSILAALCYGTLCQLIKKDKASVSEQFFNTSISRKVTFSTDG